MYIKGIFYKGESHTQCLDTKNQRFIIPFSKKKKEPGLLGERVDSRTRAGNTHMSLKHYAVRK